MTEVTEKKVVIGNAVRNKKPRVLTDGQGLTAKATRGRRFLSEKGIFRRFYMGY